MVFIFSGEQKKDLRFHLHFPATNGITITTATFSLLAAVVFFLNYSMLIPQEFQLLLKLLLLEDVSKI